MLEQAGLARMNLSALSNGHDLKLALVAKLFNVMKRFTKPVQARALGVIGKDHLSGKFASLNCEMETFQYRRVAGEKDGLPWVLELAFAWCPEMRSRRLITGVNWSPGILNPFRQLGSVV